MAAESSNVLLIPQRTMAGGGTQRCARLLKATAAFNAVLTR